MRWNGLSPFDTLLCLILCVLVLSGLRRETVQCPWSRGWWILMRHGANYWRQSRQLWCLITWRGPRGTTASRILCKDLDLKTQDRRLFRGRYVRYDCFVPCLDTIFTHRSAFTLVMFHMWVHLGIWWYIYFMIASHSPTHTPTTVSTTQGNNRLVGSSCIAQGPLDTWLGGAGDLHLHTPVP